MSENIHSTVPEHAYDRKIHIEEWKKIFMKHLRIGKENAKTCHQICVELGFKDGKRSLWRSMRTCSKLLLADGIPVLSSKSKPSGFYIARNNEEIDNWVADQQKLIKGAQRSIDHALAIRNK